MTPDQWGRVSDVVDAALEHTPEERSHFVALACSGDAAIQTEVQRLLALHGRASGFMNTPAWLKGTLPIRLPDSDGETEASVPPPLTALKPGDTFAERYEIQAELGRGGFGVVYSAFDKSSLQRTVALKVFRLTSGEPPAITELARRRFLEEARIAANLSHSNIATVYEARESAGYVYMTQELVPGRNLGQLLREGGALPPRRGVAIARQICAGLAHAHARGVVHRDIKPGNIIVDAEDGVKVTDFGIAQPPQEDSPLSGVMGGTPGYMAPEQLRAGRVDGRADIFAVGCVLYEMLTGCRPFEGATNEITLDGLRPEPSRVRGDLPRSLDRIVTRAMRKNPDERYGSITELQKELADYEESRPLWPAAIAVAALLVVIGSVFYYKRRSESLALPVPKNAGPVKKNPKDGQKYVWIPAGTFMMGCSLGDTQCNDQERPLHRVTISKGFWMGQTPVTAGAYKRFARKTGARMPRGPDAIARTEWADDRWPIVNVTWQDAHSYCSWAGGRLPTEAEWEYAARAGSTEARYGPLDEIAWYSGNGDHEFHDVGQKRPNNFGLYDMLGNVWEFVNDWYDPKYYQNSPAIDPQGPSSGQYRVLRSGSWSNTPDVIRASFRPQLDPNRWINEFGFRCVGKLGKL